MTKSTSTVRHLTQPRRGLHRDEAAIYIGVSPSKFDELVADGRMPPPKVVDGRNVWDIRKLDIAFEALPDKSRPPLNEWDQGEAAA